MENLILQIRDNNPQLADALLTEYKNSIEMLRIQFQTQMEQQQKNFDQLVLYNDDLKKQISNLTTEMSKLTSLYDEDTRARKKIQRTQFQSNNNDNVNISKSNELKRVLQINANSNNGPSPNANSAANTSNPNEIQQQAQNGFTNDDTDMNGNKTAGENSNGILADHGDGSNDSIEDDDWFLVDKKKKKNKNIQPILIEMSIGTTHIIRDLIKNKCGINGYSIQQFGKKSPVKIIPENVEIREKIMKALSENGYGFSSYNNSDEKKKCFVLKGIIADYDTDLIKHTLIKSGLFPEDTIVMKHVTGFQRQNPNQFHNTIFKVIVPANFDNNTLKSINIICGMNIKWETLKSKMVLQCKNCQRYFHSGSQCYYTKRCVKCTFPHGTDPCPRNTNNKLPVTCVNCNGNHSANNHNECDFYKKHVLPQIEKRQKQINNDNQNNTSNGSIQSNSTSVTGKHTSTFTKTAQQIGSGKTWAEIASMNGGTNKSNNNNKISSSNISKIQQHSNSGYDKGAVINQMLGIINELMQIVKNG